MVPLLLSFVRHFFAVGPLGPSCEFSRALPFPIMCVLFPILPMSYLEREQPEQQEAASNDACPLPPKRYSASCIDDVRARIRQLGSGDADRLLPSYFWGELANNT